MIQFLPDVRQLAALEVGDLEQNDLIYGVNQASGSEVINGGAGDDTIDGREGADELNGDAGNDWLYGGLGKDTLNGGIGNDVLIGSYDQDTLTGGAGDDTFVLEPGGRDVITDFEENGENQGGGDLAGDTILFGDFGTAHGSVNPTTAQFDANTDVSLAASTAVFFFDTDDGRLFFDADTFGSATVDDVLIATLDPNATVDRFDIRFDLDLLA